MIFFKATTPIYLNTSFDLCKFAAHMDNSRYIVYKWIAQK